MKRILLALACIMTPALAADAPPVPYPDGYRNWTHVKTMVIQAGHPLADAFGGMHHIYANPAALKGYKAGARFPTGSVIVFDLLDVKAGTAIEEAGRKVVGVMVKDPARWPATGGWGFEAFKGDSRTERVVGNDAVKACFNCHAPEKASDYVFSRWRP
jgi:hypothetical protein